MKTLTYVFLCIVCIVSLVCCNPYHEDVVDIRKMSTVDAEIHYESNCDTISVYATDAYVDSLSSYIARNLQYPYNELGDSIELYCSMDLVVDAKGYVSKFKEVTINEYGRWDKLAGRPIPPTLKEDAERVIKGFKFEGPSVSCHPGDSKFAADSTQFSLEFKIVPYPIDRVDSKDLVLHYLSQMSEVSGHSVGEAGKKPVGWILQQKLIAKTTAEEKIDYALNCDVPSIKLTAFMWLVGTNYPKCASIICKTLESGDTSAVKRNTGCESWTDYTVDVMLDDFFENSKLHSEVDSLMFDSLVFYSPKMGDIWYKYRLIDNMKPTPERYQRARDLYTKEHYTHALILLARYRKEQDKQLIIDALSTYSKKLAKSPDEIVEEVKAEVSPYSKPTSPRYCESEFQEALYAIEIWPDKAFAPALKNLITDISKKGINKYDYEGRRDFERLKELYNKILP